MRRTDREITDERKIDEIIRACRCCRLGLNDGGEVYIVPLSFGCGERGGKRTFYFHSAREGRKLELIGRNQAVGFELDRGCELLTGASACQYSARYQSVIGTGRITAVEEPEEKRLGLRSIMEHETGRRDWTFEEQMLRAVRVLRLEVETLSCKEHI